MPGILLLGRKSRSQHHIQTAAFFAHGVSGRTKVQNLELSCVVDAQIVRLDIPVDNALFMDGAQGIHDGEENIPGLLPGEPSAMAVYITLKIHALHKLHGKIGCAVFLEVALDPHNIGMAVELSQGLCFIQEGGLAIFKVLPVALGVGDGGMGGISGHHRIREKLLDGHQFFRLVILGNIGNAKAALPQNMACDIPSTQDSAIGQRMGILLPVLCCAAAAVTADLGTGSHLMETVIT